MGLSEENLRAEVIAFFQEKAGKPFFGKALSLTPETELDKDLLFDDEEAGYVLSEFAEAFRVDMSTMNFRLYYPEGPYLIGQVKNLLQGKSIMPPSGQPITIQMCIESAKAGHWLYD